MHLPLQSTFAWAQSLFHGWRPHSMSVHVLEHLDFCMGSISFTTLRLVMRLNCSCMRVMTGTLVLASTDGHTVLSCPIGLTGSTYHTVWYAFDSAC